MEDPTKERPEFRESDTRRSLISILWPLLLGKRSELLPAFLLTSPSGYTQANIGYGW